MLGYNNNNKTVYVLASIRKGLEPTQYEKNYNNVFDLYVYWIYDFDDDDINQYFYFYLNNQNTRILWFEADANNEDLEIGQAEFVWNNTRLINI